MENKDWDRVRTVFEQASASPTAERESVAERLCEGDAPLLTEVLSLLRASRGAEAATGFLEPVGSIDDIVLSKKPVIGLSIGPYRIDRVLGRGGMGVVCHANRADGQYQQEVAVKLLRSGVVPEDSVARFLRERQILADLAHPNIARLLDGGTTDDGLPFLVMEFVDGQPIDLFCDQRKFTIEQRLRLFVQVCDAVQFAHQALVVHRDLKPSNILVTEEAQVKLLDFGISKLLTRTAVGDSTILGQQLMTPQYASPEQARGETVTTASDVYSLGVLLYRLLSGHSPYSLDVHSPHDVVRAITERHPEAPSRAIHRADDRPSSTPEEAGTRTSDTVARLRGTDPAKLGRSLVGDIDNIVLKALHKDPLERYRSADHLAADLRRHLRGDPVQARPSTLRYRWGKFLLRHKKATAALALLLGSSLAFGLVMGVQRQQVARERDRAEAVKTFLIDLFEGANPLSNDGHEPTVREVLDRGSEKLLASELNDDYQVGVDLHETLGVIYLRLGRSDLATQHLDAALTTRLHIKGRHDRETIRLLNLKSASLIDQGDLESAEATLETALGLATDLLGVNDVRTLKIANDIGVLLLSRGQYAEAEQRLAATLALRLETRSDHLQDLAESHNNLGTALYYQGKHESAEAHYQGALDLYESLFGSQHPDRHSRAIEPGVGPLGTGCIR